MKIYITLSGPQPSARRCIVLLALASCACMNAQQNGKGPPVTTVAQVLALSADPKARIDYFQVGRVLQALAPSERKSLHRQLIAGAHPELAAMAASGVIAEGDIDSAALIASHISTWPGASSILQTLASTGRGPYMEIPRSIVRNAIKAS